ncbi:MAG: ABC transporter permease, partial [Pirellulales bacterium]|nr:ABC transporter permease [Pirellulales bacterium]
YAVARYKGWTDLIPMDLVPWFLAFQTLGVLMFGSIFLAIGAAVTQSKEAQSLLLPIWLLIALPLFGWLQIVREPNGPLAVWGSFFPLSTPLVMALRLASDAVVPLWQILASLALLVVATAAGIFLAGRVFRIGILWQGASPKFTELMRWALRG